MSPILTRPVREQLEHDRVIRQLQVRYKRKNEVIINPGNEQNQSITVGDLVVFPDLLLFADDGKRLLATVEVETGESVNSIEARAEWAVYSRIRVPLHLYVPPASVDAARRICDEFQILVAELWTYSTQFDQVRFTLVHRTDVPMAKVIIKPMPKPVPPPKEAAEPIAAKPAVEKPIAATKVAEAKPKKPEPAPKAKAAKPAPKVAKAAKPVKPAKPAPKAKAKVKPAARKAPKPAANAKPKAKAKAGKKRR